MFHLVLLFFFIIMFVIKFNIGSQTFYSHYLLISLVYNSV